MSAPDEAETAPTRRRINWLKLVIIALPVVLVAAVVLVAILFRTEEPTPAERLDAVKGERKVAQLTEENRALKEELGQVRKDYAQLVAERRCEVIDGMDDCLAAGLARPERFRESDAELMRQRELEKQRKAAAVAQAPVAEKKAANSDKAGLELLADLLKGIRGVKTER